MRKENLYRPASLWHSMLPWIILIIFELAVLLIGIWLVWSSYVGAPWLPTPSKRVRSMLEIAEVGADDIVYDLGSGDGRIIIMAAKDFGASSVGIEIDPLRLLWSKLNIRRYKLHSKVEVMRTNFFHADISPATVVTLYQGIEVNKKIRDKLAEDLKPGTRVVSYRFDVDGWVPARYDEDTSMFLYVM